MTGTAHPILAEQRDVWDRKPALRAIYADSHRRMLDALLHDHVPDGPILDVGAGSDRFRALAPVRIISLDIAAAPWVDVQADACRLPFAAHSLAGIAMLDVLHHLIDPLPFFQEARRCLKPGGRLVLIEPGMTPLSYPFYRHLHREPADMKVDPFVPRVVELDPDPFDSNQAIPTLLFMRMAHRARLLSAVAGLQLRFTNWLSLFAYPLSGGFQRWSLLPGFAANPLLRLEDQLLPVLGPFLAFRLMVVMERAE